MKLSTHTAQCQVCHVPGAGNLISKTKNGKQSCFQKGRKRDPGKSTLNDLSDLTSLQSSAQMTAQPSFSLGSNLGE